MDKLANRYKNSNALTTQSPQSLKAAHIMLTLACAKFGKELTSPEASSWMEVLSEQQPEAIEWSFKQYFRTPPHNGNTKWFPEEWQIIELLKAWNRNKLQAQKEAEERAEREETERRRANGQLIGWAEVKEIFREALEKIEARKFPELPSGRKEQLQQQIVNLHRKSREKKSTQQAGHGDTQGEAEQKG